MDRRSLLLSPLALAAGSAAAKTSQKKAPATAKWPAPSAILPLWPAGVPGPTPAGLKEVVIDEPQDGMVHFRHLYGVSVPRLAVFPAAKNAGTRPNGGAMLVIPGGGFVNNYFDHEGYMLADYLNGQGITCFVLFYRLAHDGWADPADVALIDTWRAMRLIRAHAADYRLDTTRVGVIGFSAGGFLTSSLATRHAQPLYAPVDSVDALDARPTLAAPIYPVQSIDPAYAYSGVATELFGGNVTSDLISKYSPDRNVDANTPPVFLTHAEDDTTVPVQNTVAFRDALRAQKILCETHLFASGGHGFGMKPDMNQPYHVWPELFAAFARAQGLMG